MVELIGCILLSIIGVTFICMVIDELKEKLTKYESLAADYEKTKFEKEKLDLVLKLEIDEYNRRFIEKEND